MSKTILQIEGYNIIGIGIVHNKYFHVVQYFPVYENRPGRMKDGWTFTNDEGMAGRTSREEAEEELQNALANHYFAFSKSREVGEIE